jgi:membrane-associated phospholipid phosphatase
LHRLLAFAFFFLASTTAAASPNTKVEWKAEWPRVTQWETLGTIAATGATFVVERRLPEPSSTRIDVEVPVLDPGARYLLRGRTKHEQDVFGTYSDVGFRMMAFFPYVVDVAVVTLGVHRQPDVAAQMALIDLQALTLSGFTQLLASRLVGRARPYKQDCNEANAKTITRDCGGENDNKSFFSGHSAAAFTTAGLTCIHHENLPLYGGGAIEQWACVWALSVATATGVFRVVSDAHYASDVLFGAGVGWFYGYVMPKLLHYKNGAPKPRDEHDVLWMPSFLPVAEGGGVSVTAVF